jgi:CspA family cold shock protein
MVDGKVTGKVKFYNRTKGFGFIMRGPGERDVFVHAKDLPMGVIELLADQPVRFVLESGQRGPRARALEVVDAA